MIKNFKCTKCGNCCRTVKSFNGKATDKDFERWRENKRDDILEWVVRDRFWFYPGTNELAKKCPWIKGNLCGIHDVKPDWCRDFPMTPQIAILNKCPGLIR